MAKSYLDNFLKPYEGFYKKAQKVAQPLFVNATNAIANAGETLERVKDIPVIGQYASNLIHPERAFQEVASPGGGERFQQKLLGNIGPGGMGIVGGVKKVAPQAVKEVAPSIFKGLKNTSTKLLESFRGMADNIKVGQFEEIINKAKKSGIKEIDEKIIRNSAVIENGRVNLTKTAQKVEEQLVPLTPTPVKSPRWSNVGQDFIGDGKYGEIVYQSPIKTSAGDVHFRTQGTPGGVGSYDLGNQQPFPNYFSHVRYEDMADGKTRKILETQSDLMQKENFAKELYDADKAKGLLTRVEQSNLPQDKIRERVLSRKAELSKLSAYESNDPLAQLRTFREEVKRAAKDGKDTILIPSGKTAMKIEGLGEEYMNAWEIIPAGRKNIAIGDFEMVNFLTKDSMKVGQEISRENMVPDNQRWIITDVLGDGKIKAITRDGMAMRLGIGESALSDMTNERLVKAVNNSPALESAKETFDISGKVDTKHFVYKLNEEAIPREARKMGLEVVGKIKEGQGDWWKIKINPERGKLPVEAFGAIPFLPQFANPNDSREEQPLFIQGK